MRNPFDYDLFGLMLLKQPGVRYEWAEVILDETLLIVKFVNPSGKICSLEIRDLIYKEITKVVFAKTLIGI